MSAEFVSPDRIRTRFSRAMSNMYRQEVPQYGTLLQLVGEINAGVLAERPAGQVPDEGELARLDVERHGAIRLGTPEELATMREVFAVMGMFPVGYYDLAEAGVPVHATAFRPVDEAALAHNPFRVFTSLLRLELIDDEPLREQARRILAARDIFTPRLRELLAEWRRQGGLSDRQADEFVMEALETFRWHSHATVDRPTYERLHEVHRLIADVVCFRGPHINHLTPRTLDIDATQAAMPEHGITPKATIEGPPRRECPILLRQTSFRALEESILFAGEEEGSHTARFGEIEQRGMALTPRGRELYDQLLSASKATTGGLSGEAHQQALAEAFREFPDDETVLRREGLGYFRYHLTEQGRRQAGTGTLPEEAEALIERGLIEASPIIYEDFLPVSAAGIFQSNLGDSGTGKYAQGDNQAAFEAALGVTVHDPFALYEAISQESLATCRRALQG
ncbi:putative glyoxalase superfamily metalloenzyme YdcJ [Kushneria sinocarnis]|uniref:2-oxoadipate dioxygenase/decarboxylase n=1 Tax=Kushneria sinocarnis TaxID=595502 RepID=A0A420X1A1_9GAMM|nr:VOC family protein [Kushneria sinocarnis]RKR07621.1 putative glyoxalase superfamily metalloenzyme YdcJ [Kushneria sinocarnis]